MRRRSEGWSQVGEKASRSVDGHLHIRHLRWCAGWGGREAKATYTTRYKQAEGILQLVLLQCFVHTTYKQVCVYVRVVGFLACPHLFLSSGTSPRLPKCGLTSENQATTTTKENDCLPTINSRFLLQLNEQGTLRVPLKARKITDRRASGPCLVKLKLERSHVLVPIARNALELEEGRSHQKHGREDTKSYSAGQIATEDTAKQVLAQPGNPSSSRFPLFLWVLGATTVSIEMATIRHREKTTCIG